MRHIISIHAPRTGSDTFVCTPNTRSIISIHAPRTGSDGQPRKQMHRACRFQSTLPARGATVTYQRDANIVINFNPRSPHGERRCWKTQRRNWRNFNPRSPHGERLRQGVFDFPPVISIHAPRTGSDPPRAELPAQVHISIHAPRTGSDHLRADMDEHVRNFNPRSPHGERQVLTGYIPCDIIFQSTLPARGATILIGLLSSAWYFNPRSPHGERLSAKRRWLSAWHFNPRSPHGERLGL